MNKSHISLSTKMTTLLSPLIVFLYIFATSLSANAANVTEMPAVANWDAVPHQVLNIPVNIGAVAFHPSGIKKVEFSINNGLKYPVYQMALNPATNVVEYFIYVNPSQFNDGPITITATAYPEKGLSKELDPLVLYVNYKKTISEKKVYVSTSGSDQPVNGTQTKPLKTIAYALKMVGEGGIVELTQAGSYYLTDTAGKKGATSRWTTIQGASGINRNSIILTMPSRASARLQHDKLLFRNLSIDFGLVQQIYAENGQSLWFDNVRWFDSNGPDFVYAKNTPPVRTSVYIKGYYVTNSIAENATYGFVDALLARNTKVSNVSADAYQNVRTAINVEAENLDYKKKPEIHSDIFQYYGNYDNLIVYGVSAFKNIIGIQNFFFDHVTSSFSNSAFVNVCIDNTEGNPPYSQLNSKHKNMYFKNVKTYGQNWYLRDDMPDPETFVSENVIFENCSFKKLARGQKLTGYPDGVTVINSQVEGYQLGTGSCSSTTTSTVNLR